MDTWVAAQTWERQHFRDGPTLSPARNIFSPVVSHNKKHRIQSGRSRYYSPEIFLKTDFQKWIYVEKKIIFRMAELKFTVGFKTRFGRGSQYFWCTARPCMHQISPGLLAGHSPSSTEIFLKCCKSISRKLFSKIFLSGNTIMCCYEPCEYC